MTDAQQAIEAYIGLTETPKAMELWALVEQHCKPISPSTPPATIDPEHHHREEP